MTLQSMHNILGLALGLTLVGAGAHGQTTVPTVDVVETAHVNVVNVEAFVTGKDGRPVRGLRREDFELLEDGKPVVVTNFAAFALTEPPPIAETPAIGQTPEAPGEVAMPTPVSPEQMLSLVFYIDNANISPTRRNDILGTLGTLLPEMLRSGRVQVLLASGGLSVQIRQPFTADAREVLAGLDGLKHEAGEAGAAGADSAMLSRVMDRTSMSDGSSANPVSDQISDFLTQARSAAEMEYQRTLKIVTTMTQFVSSLAGVPGRKIVLYIGKGLPMRPGEDLLQKFEALYAGSGVAPGFSATMETSRFSMTEPFRNLVRRANAGQVTIYAIEAAGDGGGGATAEQSSMVADLSIQTGGRSGALQSLLSMSGPTGGRAIATGPGQDTVLARAVEDLGSYYSLGYAPPHGNDGAYHTLKVRVKGEGLSIRAREGYMDLSTDDRMAACSLGGLLFNLASNQLGAGISVKPEGQAKGDAYAVTVLVTIPLDKLVLQPRGDAHEASVSLWFASLEAGNRVSQLKKQVFEIRIPNEKLLTALGQAAGYTFRLNLHRGQHRVAVSLRDDLGEVEATLTSGFSVGEDATGPAPS